MAAGVTFLEAHQATCEACFQKFSMEAGGICTVCDRLLCSRHLHGMGGVVRQLFRRPRRRVPVCVACAGKSLIGLHNRRSSPGMEQDHDPDSLR